MVSARPGASSSGTGRPAASRPGPGARGFATGYRVQASRPGTGAVISRRDTEPGPSAYSSGARHLGLGLHPAWLCWQGHLPGYGARASAGYGARASARWNAPVGSWPGIGRSRPSAARTCGASRRERRPSLRNFHNFFCTIELSAQRISTFVFRSAPSDTKQMRLE